MKAKFLIFMIFCMLCISSVTAYAKDDEESGTEVLERKETETFDLKDFQLEGKELDEYTGNKSVVHIPEGIRSIGHKAFHWKENLREVYLPESVKSIAWDAFSECHKLRKVVFTKNVTKIDEEAFYCCTGIDYFVAEKGSIAYKFATYNSVPVVTSEKTRFLKKHYYLLAGDKQRYPLVHESGKVLYHTTNEKIATVSKYGKIKARKPGTTILIAKYNGKKYSCKLTVYKRTENNRVRQVLHNETNSKMNKLEKINAFYNWLAVHAEYDSDNPFAMAGIGYRRKDCFGGHKISEFASDYTAAGALLKGKAVCQGFALAFQKMMKAVKVPCRLAKGYGHMWNVVKLNGKWYNVDVSSDTSWPARVSHAFFLKSGRGYYPQNSVPKCKDKTYEDFWKYWKKRP